MRDLGNKNKREQIFAWLMQKDYAICLLQETHTGEGTHNTSKEEWDNDAFFSGRSTNSEGIGILINPKISCTIQNYKAIVSGRLRALEL